MVRLATGESGGEKREFGGSMSPLSKENNIDNSIIVTHEITLNGLVQGVGFRPFVYQLAKELGIHGQTQNGSEGVSIVFNATENVAQRFHGLILNQAPKLAKITFSNLKISEKQHFKDFSIHESSQTGNVSLLLPPDFGMCPDCRVELHDEQNRRFRYPFITCTHCGPRYSIITQLPYDRPQTTMQAFTMCKACETEYNNPDDRRFYAQTNSCSACGPKLGWYKTENGEAQKISELQDGRWILARAKWALEAGKVLAVKGIGGYLLLCDATNESAVLKLRERKHRPTKPFAVLFPDLTRLKNEAFVNTTEAKALESVAAPIVLLKQRVRTTVVRQVNPNLNYVGVMLPYAPLLELLAKDFGKPLVATSGNISGSPIIFEDEKALTTLAPLVDYILTHNRPIEIPQDDSVIRFSRKYQQKIYLRRSRGELLNASIQPLKKNDLALAYGASLKSTFSFQTTDNVYVSQYLGDLESFETQLNFEQVLNHFFKIFKHSESKKMLLCDAHEGYFSTQLAIQLSEKWNLPVQEIQHHQAHLAAVLAENELDINDESVLGIIWDGTGYGTDGNIWGGEFFIKNQRFHFDYFDAILGDKMPKEPRISAFCLTYNLEGFEEISKENFSNQEWNLYLKVIKNNTLKTSSVGRIFDGVACLLGLSAKQSYEGEAAIQLEELAEKHFEENEYDFEEFYLIEISQNVPTQQMIKGILNDFISQKSREYIAAKFHNTLVQIIKLMAEKQGVRKLAFSGGVFQNALLVDLIIHRLSKDFSLFFHKNLSPNDENISFGQMASFSNLNA
jgi:hydrogenase maturation protein HypF